MRSLGEVLLRSPVVAMDSAEIEGRKLSRRRSRESEESQCSRTK